MRCEVPEPDEIINEFNRQFGSLDNIHEMETHDHHYEVVHRLLHPQWVTKAGVEHIIVSPEETVFRVHTTFSVDDSNGSQFLKAQRQFQSIFNEIGRLIQSGCAAKVFRETPRVTSFPFGKKIEFTLCGVIERDQQL